MRWNYLRLTVVLVIPALILSGCGGSTGTVVGLSDEDLRGGYAPAAGESDEAAAGGGLMGYDSDGDEPTLPTANRAPTIESVSFVGDTITVIASDPDGDALTYLYVIFSGDVILTPQGDGSSALVATMHDGEVACEIRIIVSDGRGGEDSAIVAGMASAKPAENSILMVFDRVSVDVGEPVTITVYAYELAEPLLYLNSAMIEFNGFRVDTGDENFDVNTMNLGAVGGGADEPDGIWAGNSGANYGLFLGGMNLFGLWDAHYFIGGVQLPEGRRYLAVNVSPVYATSTIPAGSSGALFNFTLFAETPGIVTFKFVHEYQQSPGAALIAGTLYSPNEFEHSTFSDEQIVAIEVGG